MKLSIIIVSWNIQKLTQKCVESIFAFIKNIDLEIFVVDNNSADDTVKILEKYKTENTLDNLNIIVNKENVGFAKANNQALKMLWETSPYPLLSKEGSLKTSALAPDKAESLEIPVLPLTKGEIKRGSYILLLNPDTEFVDDKIKKALEFMENNPEIGILGPKLLNTDDSLQRSCRRFPNFLDQLFIQLKFYNFFPNRIKATREYFMLDFEHNENREVDQVMGAAMLIKREVVEKVGLLDEKFWAIFEEVDFCQRTKNVGYKIFFYASWQIYHHKEQSFGQWPALRKQINFNHSLYHYFKKHKPFWQLFLLWLVQPINLLLTWIDVAVGIRKKAGKSKDT
ncbi:MAG TPA: glycosyltransferase family 2 protein [bacterium]|nr:glycosyltransferase family 2 protein [bacterium]